MFTNIVIDMFMENPRISKNIYNNITYSIFIINLLKNLHNIHIDF